MKAIAEHPTAEMYKSGKEIDCQCARCGSSAGSEECAECGGEGLDGHDCGDDCCCCLHPEDNVPCQYCRGNGVYHFCLSSAEWCEANPLPGREEVPRGKIEWYTH
jgi:hypothetical protein